MPHMMRMIPLPALGLRYIGIAMRRTSLAVQFPHGTKSVGDARARLLFVSCTPLGCPVVPLVYICRQTSSGSDDNLGSTSDCASRHSTYAASRTTTSLTVVS